jgi:hypothetical protein
MSTKRTDATKKALVTQDELDKAVSEAREQVKIAARLEVGEWIEANLVGGPKENPYTTFFPQLAKRLKEGKRL